MKLFFGIDGGGTKTKISAVNENDTVLYEGVGHATNIHSVGKNVAIENISLLIKDMLKFLKVNQSDFSFGCFGCAGIYSEEEKKFFENIFKKLLQFECPVFVCNDTIPALVGGIGKVEGFILISGTGAIASGLKKDGTSVRAGGWGHTLGDEGSGYWIGSQGIIRGIHSQEKREIESVLPEKILSYYSAQSFRDLFPFVYTSFDKAKIAQFAKVVFNEAKAGDALCIDILQKAEDYLVGLCVSVYKQIGSDLESKELVFSGGILENEPLFCDNIKESCVKKLHDIKIVERRNTPSFGACLLAKHLYRGI